LPRWLEAFPKADVVAFGTAVKPLPATTLVWLYLNDGGPSPEQLAALQQVVGSARIIVLADRPDSEQARTLIAVGGRGYCNAHAAAANLRRVAGVVQAGGLWIGEELMRRLLTSTQAAMSRMPAGALPHAATNPAIADRLATLTRREREVAGAVADGSSNKEIARQLGITERTVKAHTGAVFHKLNARDRLHLALMINSQRPS
jgi:two-component system nitrate/nitrite response regulator NarL